MTSVKGAVTDSYSYPATSNRLTSITLGAGGSRPFTYDGAGNVITDTRSGTVYGYTYNSAGRLSALSVGGVATATYRYDAMGRQATRTLVPSGVTIHSVFDSQGRRIAEYTEGTGAIIREYVWMGWEPVAVIEGGVVCLIRGLSHRTALVRDDHGGHQGVVGGVPALWRGSCDDRRAHRGAVCGAVVPGGGGLALGHGA